MRRFDTFSVLAGFAAILLVSILACPSVFAAGANKAKAAEVGVVPGGQMVKSDSPINITADRMEARQEERMVVFDGNVRVQQDDLTLTGNRLKVVMLPAEKSNGPASPSEKVDYIELEGNVKVTQRDRLATAQKGIYYQKEQKIVLNGHPVVTRGQDRVEGNLITIFLQQNRSVVEGGSGTPVQAVLFPGKKE